MLKSAVFGIFVAFVLFIWFFGAFLIGSKDFFSNHEARAYFAITYCVFCPIVGAGAAIVHYENTKNKRNV